MGESAGEASPIETVVVVEAPILGGDEGLLHVGRDLAQLDVDPPDDREPADQAPILVDDPAPFPGMKSANLGCAWAARVAARI